MNTMKDKTIIITGGAGEIGMATAKLFVAAESNVVLVDLNQEALEKAKKSLGGKNVEIFAADVTDELEVKKYVDFTVKKFKTIDMFFNNAGIEGGVTPITDLAANDFNAVMQVNVYGVYYGMKHVMKAMEKKGGSIVISSSVAGLQGTAGMLPYITSKHAVVGIMRTAALEGAPNSIRVNTVHPGVVDSRMMDSLEKGLGDDQNAVKESFKSQVPLGRYAQEDEIADTVFFLLSDKARYTTGATYVIDGGLTVG